MFDLQPCVHLHEPDAIGAKSVGGIGDEFDRSGADIIDRARGLNRRPADNLSGRCVHARRRRLDHLLVTALQRTVVP